jgi:hypothetical protein
MATLYWKDGKPYDIDQEHLDQAFKDGFRLPTQDEANRLRAADQPFQAAAEGALRGATLGLSDVLSTASKEDILLRKEENPGISTATELGGAIVSPAAKLKLAAPVAMGLYGLSGSLNESYLHNDDPELAAQKAAAGALTGAILGKAGQTAIKLGGAGLSKVSGTVSEKLGEGGLKGAVQELADRIKAPGPDDLAGGIGREVLKTVAPAAAGALVGGVVDGKEGAGIGAMMGMSKGLAWKLGKKVLPLILESPALQNMAAGFYKQTTEKLAMAPELLGKFAPILQDAAAKGANELLATHIGIAKSEEGQRYLSSLGLSPETPEEVKGAQAKSAAFTAIQQSVDAYDKRLQKSVAGVFKSGKEDEESDYKPIKSGKEYQTKIDQLKQLVADPTAAYELLPSQLMNYAPQIAGGAMSTALQGAQFLLAKAPKNPSEGLPEALKKPWEPGPVEMERWNRYVKAVEDPQSALQQLSNGQMNVEQKEALQQVYPRLYADLKERLFEQVNKLKQPLPYEKRLALVSCFGSDILGVSQQQLQFYQAAHTAASQQNKPMGKPDGRMTVDTQKNLETQGQKLESRDG